VMEKAKQLTLASMGLKPSELLAKVESLLDPSVAPVSALGRGDTLRRKLNKLRQRANKEAGRVEVEVGSTRIPQEVLTTISTGEAFLLKEGDNNGSFLLFGTQLRLSVIRRFSTCFDFNTSGLDCRRIYFCMYRCCSQATYGEWTCPLKAFHLDSKPFLRHLPTTGSISCHVLMP
jgi:hypothetical protein